MLGKNPVPRSSSEALTPVLIHSFEDAQDLFRPAREDYLPVGRKIAVKPGHSSEIMGVSVAAASKSRTDGL